jgi:hypothetical protein
VTPEPNIISNPIVTPAGAGFIDLSKRIRYLLHTDQLAHCSLALLCLRSHPTPKTSAIRTSPKTRPAIPRPRCYPKTSLHNEIRKANTPTARDKRNICCGVPNLVLFQFPGNSSNHTPESKNGTPTRQKRLQAVSKGRRISKAHYTPVINAECLVTELLEPTKEKEV